MHQSGGGTRLAEPDAIPGLGVGRKLDLRRDVFRIGAAGKATAGPVRPAAVPHPAPCARLGGIPSRVRHYVGGLVVWAHLAREHAPVAAALLTPGRRGPNLVSC